MAENVPETAKALPASITQEELQKLYSEHALMQQEIKKLSTCLVNYEKKWSKIVKNVIQENAELKSENEKMKRRAKAESARAGQWLGTR